MIVAGGGAVSTSTVAGCFVIDAAVMPTVIVIATVPYG